MAGRRTVDTSGMFKSMMGYDEKVEVKATDETVPAQKTSVQDSEGATRTKKRGNPADLQSVKVCHYMTPRIMEAMKLYKTRHLMGGHEDSKIINEALAQFFNEELEVLNSLPAELSAAERLQAAAKILWQR